MHFKCTECWFPKLRSGVNGALNLEHSQEAVKEVEILGLDTAGAYFIWPNPDLFQFIFYYFIIKK